MNIKKETVEWIQVWLIFLSGVVVGYMLAPAQKQTRDENCHKYATPQGKEIQIRHETFVIPPA